MPGGTSSARTVFQIEDPESQVADVPGSGDFVEIHCDLNTLTYRRQQEIEEDRSFCDTQKDYGSPNISVSGAGRWAGDVDRAFRLLSKAQREKIKIGYRYGPGGTATGAYGLSGILIVGTTEIGARVGQLQALTFEAGVDGEDHEFTWPVA